MTQSPGDTDAIQALRARNTLVQTVRTQLKGSGLDIRELASHLVISLPGHPDHGRIYIKYATGDVSLRRCTWDYLGHLKEHAASPPDADPHLTTAQLIATLTTHPGTPT